VDSWRHNARQVAAEVAAAAARVGAQALVLSGDVRAVQLLEQRLPDDPTLFIRHVTGSRSADGSQLARAARLATALKEIEQAQTQHLIQVFQAYLDPAGRAVQGRQATLAALAADRVATLLVSPETAAGQAWFGEQGTAVYLDRESALVAGRPIHSGRLVDVAIRSALLSGARVRILPPGLDGAPVEGIGALCRFHE
jgi:peptide subunit release factor 1 (eRF1)